LDVTGGLAYFGGTGGNRISVSNNVCDGACQTFHGIPVFFQNGATPANLAIGPNPLKNPDLGALTTSGPGAAAIILDGPTSRVSISGR
ncbi:MAG TPA: hypothetical protein VLF19_12310, partial [Methylomirabilota bacterium]|nr:hypothetical protein [Methylomirabilota bacterium]